MSKVEIGMLSCLLSKLSRVVCIVDLVIGLFLKVSCNLLINVLGLVIDCLIK